MWKLKTGENGEAILQDGLPVYVLADGTEKATDVAAMADSLAKANGEAAKFRKRAKEAEGRLQLFGDLDPESAKAAVAFREGMGDDFDPDKAAHQLADLRSQVAGLTTQVEERDAKLATQSETIDRLSYDVEIRGSEFISTKVAPALRDPGRFRAAFEKHLDRDDSGRIVVKDGAGNTIMSETNTGQPAGLDEALPKIVTSPHDLAAGNAAGGGQKSNATATTATVGGKKFADMTPAERAKAVRDAGGDLTALGFENPPTLPG